MKRSPLQDPVRVAALYRFAPVDAPKDLRDRLDRLCSASGIKGTLLVAYEGLNGTVAGTADAIDGLVSALRILPGFDGLDVKYSTAVELPFRRMKVKVKREIVTMGVDGIAAADAGTHVEPADWNDLISDPETVVIDTRNVYETAIGSFAGAVDPGTASFAEFPAWAQARRGDLAGRKVAMFCTGGIRCEKATAYMRSIGVDNVFHLKGGILKYLEDVPASESLWRGECFVFDERVSVAHGLAQGSAVLCRACRHPLVEADLASDLFQEGVSCPHCFADRSDRDRSRYAERQRQVALAERRGKEPHLPR